MRNVLFTIVGFAATITIFQKAPALFTHNEQGRDQPQVIPAETLDSPNFVEIGDGPTQ